jgi:hypothetical protein
MYLSKGIVSQYPSNVDTGVNRQMGGLTGTVSKSIKMPNKGWNLRRNGNKVVVVVIFLQGLGQRPVPVQKFNF